MDAQFTIQLDVPRDLMCITLSGFFDPDALQRFATARSDAQRQLGCAANLHLTLVDIRGMRIQTQDIVSAFGTLLADPRVQARRLAFVVGSTLARMQVLRAAATRDARIFADMKSAREWLFSDENVSGHEQVRVRAG